MAGAELISGGRRAENVFRAGLALAQGKHDGGRYIWSAPFLGGGRYILMSQFDLSTLSLCCKLATRVGGKIIAHPHLLPLCEFAEGKLVKD